MELSDSFLQQRMKRSCALLFGAEVLMHLPSASFSLPLCLAEGPRIGISEVEKSNSRNKATTICRLRGEKGYLESSQSFTQEETQPGHYKRPACVC